MSVINSEFREGLILACVFRGFSLWWADCSVPVVRQTQCQGVQVGHTIYLMVAGKESWKGWRGRMGFLVSSSGVSPSDLASFLEALPPVVLQPLNGGLQLWVSE